MSPELEAALLSRYKLLCDTVDDYRNRGMFDDADKLVHSEMQMVLQALLGEQGKTLAPEAERPAEAGERRTGHTLAAALEAGRKERED